MENNDSQKCVCSGKGPALSQMLEALLPSGAASEHFRNARIELLKGVRELIDSRIETLSSQPSAGPRTGTKLNVE